MSEIIQDPTGEYQRHERKLRWSRRGTFLSGIINVTIGLLGLLFSVTVLGYLLWTHVTSWFSYGMMVCLLAYCVFMIFSGRQRIQWGRRVVAQQEVQQAKQQHRQSLQEAVQGKLPATYSRSSRYVYLGCTLLFGLLAAVTWYDYFAYHVGGGTRLRYRPYHCHGICSSGFPCLFHGKSAPAGECNRVTAHLTCRRVCCAIE